MSTPHFLDSDPKLAEAIDGISPVREAHKTILNLEPHTGMPLQAHKRIQISVPLRQDPALTCLSTATPVGRKSEIQHILTYRFVNIFRMFSRWSGWTRVLTSHPIF